MMRKLIELQGEINESTITPGDFDTSLSEMEKSSKQQGRTELN